MTKKKEVFDEFNKHKREVIELKSSLNQINDQKEAWFKKKDEFGKQISKLIKQVKSDKEKRNEFTKKVKEDKKHREDYNTKIKKKIESAKKLNKEKTDLMTKHNITENPSNIASQIERLDTIIETEGVSFEKEKKLMKEINTLKKKQKESKKVNVVFEQSKGVSKEIDALKEKSEEFHKKVQSRAKESQEKHESVINLSKEIDELKKKEEDAFKKFIESKKKFVEVNDQLKEKLKLLGKSQSGVTKFKGDKEKKEKKVVHDKLQSKKDAVEEKIAKGEKLTTEDLLIMQGMD